MYPNDACERRKTGGCARRGHLGKEAAAISSGFVLWLVGAFDSYPLLVPEHRFVARDAVWSSESIP